MVEILKSMLFGLVEGITEWLPISSTGHMLLLDQFVRLDVSPDFWHMFLVVIQLGAILAVVVLFFNQLNVFSLKKTPQERKNIGVLWLKTIVACIPAACLGIPFDDIIDAYLSTPFVIAATLIFYGVAFIVIERIHKTKANSSNVLSGKHLSRVNVGTDFACVNSIEELDWKTALGIGAFQVLSLVPGTSRSGATIIGGLILGCSRTVAAEFTFYLAIPVMAGASLLRLVKFFIKGNLFTMNEALILGVGALSAFVVSVLVIKFLMTYIKKHDFQAFGWYRIFLGLLVLGYFLIR